MVFLIRARPRASGQFERHTRDCPNEHEADGARRCRRRPCVRGGLGAVRAALRRAALHPPGALDDPARVRRPAALLHRRGARHRVARGRRHRHLARRGHPHRGRVGVVTLPRASRPARADRRARGAVDRLLLLDRAVARQRRPARDLPRRLRHDPRVRVRHRRRDALGRPRGARVAGIRRRQPARGPLAPAPPLRAPDDPRRGALQPRPRPRRGVLRRGRQPVQRGPRRRRPPGARPERRRPVGDDPHDGRPRRRPARTALGGGARGAAVARVAAHPGTARERRADGT